VLGRGSRIAVSGIVVGVFLALGMAQGLTAQIPQIQGLNLFAYLAAAVLVGCASLLAIAFPAWQASRIDPQIALRGE